MNVLLDTNVLSEVRRPAPDPRVLAWLDAIDEDRTYISVASIAELKRGIALMDDGRRRTALSDWLAQDLPERFAGRILPIDPAIAGRWGDLMAEARMSGLSLSVMDGFFAATALDRNLVLATRNTKDFAPLGVSLFNPWTDGGQSR
ncbi:MULTISPECIES: type II toxin-antitoxin system VapC family toxin [Xanthobacter]|uniref:type II toxin-antitoxin system VapC family toxin n=1 Tax=Xanthobacter TaxID=279 RepID=UPI0024A67413|nr:type II toxin-antitoxin system VapC family toxin [Xanthobacter autotrophicus]MDI4655189.1 type II toxin-antitoxin system VapC family toxin [Xanthobacter autotrophicus]MDI4666528.1 type II toxin-antitoxin system VapC family toxin [Xanthobacter autotrophicus]